MKKIILIAAMAAFAVSTYAQLGVQVGYVLPTTTSKTDSHKTSVSINGIQAGVNYTYYYNDNFFVQPALLYTYGFKNENTEAMGVNIGKSALTSHTIDLPIRLGYSLPIADDFKVFAFAGPDFQYNIDQINKFKIGDGDWSKGASIYGTKDIPNKDFSHLDILLGAGIGATYKSITLKAGYDFGLLNKYVGDLDKSSIHTNAFSVALGFAF
ncbi:MAG: PorT family protein [Paludibacter sp.]|jgi:hypothetical protein|nr:PorT family protein [Paludibacter sp.]